MWQRTAKAPDRAARAENRELRLEEAGVPRTIIDELTARVDLARRLAPEQAELYALDDLLDHYADVAIVAEGGFAELAEEIAELVRLTAAVAVMPPMNELMRAEEAMCAETVAGTRIELRLAKLTADGA